MAVKKKKASAKKAPAKKKRGTKRRRGVTLEPTDIEPSQVRIDDPPADVAALARSVEADGGAVLATYREPLGGHALMLTALPIEKVKPTPFQRDVSDAHVRKLTRALERIALETPLPVDPLPPDPNPTGEEDDDLL